LRVDLAYKKGTILREIGEIIDSRCKANNIIQKNVHSKGGWGLYKKYIKIYDLRTNQKLTYKRIATQVLKKPIAEVGREDEDNICKAYQVCRKIVDGGYRKII
jgi:hypothetical protein